MSKTKIKKPPEIKVSVTATDIRLGVPENPKSCPIARAISRCAPRYYVAVAPDAIYVANHVYKPSDTVQKFIYDFDRENRVKPFKFTLSKKKTS